MRKAASFVIQFLRGQSGAPPFEIVITLLIFVSLAQEMNRRLQVQREVIKLEQDVQSMQKTVIELKNLNQYFQTDAYQERLAREKLNYSAPGEKVVLIPDQQYVNSPPSEEIASTADISIPEKWWRIFFVQQK